MGCISWSTDKPLRKPVIYTNNDYDITRGFKLLYDEKKYDKSILCKNTLQSVMTALPMGYRISESWNLAYSTTEHGFSLRTLYDNVKQFAPPYVIICKDDDNKKFGVYYNGKISLKKVTTHERNAFLFKINDIDSKRSITKFSYTGIDPYFCICEKDYLAFGCDDSSYGLLFNSNMLSGETNSVTTFNNELLTSDNYFKINTVEIWSISL
ncbi:Oxidation resistance protein [Spraguea lophii 42_110]|uniref:Oxidation resistance protein n=1 Tax=Spraguea lophii (strain 42_110) TaxID=1358809 RepID=S7W5S7_SPRLO|nr:Oxidation resistance protein [Spraguea lophii 42_110]